MNEAISYGGNWTGKKLTALQDYLQRYLDVFKNQRHWVTLYYIDAFAGPGLWQRAEGENRSPNLVDDPDSNDLDSKQYKSGSPMIALAMPEPGFGRFIFVEESKKYLATLKKQVEKEHPEKISGVEFVQGDANVAVRCLCDKWDARSRAVVFLDPFGMQVEWRTIEAIAQTQAMDLWVMFPLGIAVNRLLTKDGGEIRPTWEEKLDALFGTGDWREHFYRRVPTTDDLWGDKNEEFLAKIASFEKIADYFIGRLGGIFAGVAENPLILRNSKGNPMFALCFAAGNPEGAKIGVRIAKHIIGKER